MRKATGHFPGKRFGSRIFASFVPWLILGCAGNTTEPEIDPNPDIRSLVTEEIAASLDKSGHFLMDPNAHPELEPVPVISAGYAQILAAGYLKSFGVSLSPAWERDRGARINTSALAVSPRVYIAETPFGPVPNVGCHPAFAHWFGSFYLMTYDGDGGP
jgi:hypothetical protein